MDDEDEVVFVFFFAVLSDFFGNPLYQAAVVIESIRVNFFLDVVVSVSVFVLVLFRIYDAFPGYRC